MTKSSRRVSIIKKSMTSSEDEKRMPPPPLLVGPSSASKARGSAAGESTIRNNLSTRAKGNAGLGAGLPTVSGVTRRTLAPNTTARNGSRGQVPLKQGRSPMDWERQRTSGVNLRGIESMGPIRVSKEELAKHNTKEDAWTALAGKVYNISPYLEYHPGGEEQLMRCAGRDGTRLFQLTHAWVNYEHMLDRSIVGFYCP